MSKQHSIKTVYIVHHSHTDIGYTDLQERILDFQVDHIRSAIRLLKKPENREFRWNCETYFCVERFLSEASEQERADFFALAREGRMGISANYLNFCDLADYEVLRDRLAEMVSTLKQENIPVKTAMCADINGISMGQRDAMLENGVEFLFTNIHTHHGMYPLYQNQNAYWWESASGKRLLVWNGEHYNLGNALGIMPSKNISGMEATYFGERRMENCADNLNKNLEAYLDECEEAGYPYDFIISSVSGEFTDNAPPNDVILRTIEAYRAKFGEDVKLQMVSLQELYRLIRDKIADSPVYRGDLTDWWAHGAGSTPYAVKHYREAAHMYRKCGKLVPDIYQKYPELARTAQDNLLLYAEHTWGHSSTISNPYDTMVLNLDMRKNSYASKAHEASALMLNRAMLEIGADLCYYATNGKVRVINTGKKADRQLVEFYIEALLMPGIAITNLATGEKLEAQISPHPRGFLVSFLDDFAPGESKEYSYEEIRDVSKAANTRHAYMGAERVRDVVNDYETLSYPLLHRLENEWFRLEYDVDHGFTSFYNKQTGQEMLGDGLAKFFTPVYERTELHESANTERAHIGRNIRGVHAKRYQAEMSDIKVLDAGEVFITMQFDFVLEGTRHCDVILKFFRNLPRIDYRLRMAKTISDDIESVFLPLTLNLPERELFLEKGTEPFRPGIDQIPGTCMEYYMSDLGAVYRTGSGSVLLSAPDVPLYYMGEMKHHDILLCDGKPENNRRDLYSWVMNNCWETNFKMDLSGFGEFCYRLELSDETNPEACFEALKDSDLGACAYILKD